MSLLSTRNQAQKQPLLTRDDWIIKALEMLTLQGIHAVQITAISKALDVTRGSFYWHFENREDLLDALISEWRARNTGIMIRVLSQSPNLETGILDLFSVWVDHAQFDPDLDQAIRDWGRNSPDVQKLIQKEDDDRVEAIASFFEKHSYEKTEAFIRARVIYFTQLSFYSLKISEPLEKRLSYLAAYFQCFTGKGH